MRRRNVKENEEEELLDEDEQREIVDNLKNRNKASDKIFKIAIKSSGLILAGLKIFCIIIQLSFPYRLPMYLLMLEKEEDIESNSWFFFTLFVEAITTTIMVIFAIWTTKYHKHTKEFIILEIGLTASFILFTLIGLISSSHVLNGWLILAIWSIGITLFFGMTVQHFNYSMKKTSASINELENYMYPYKKP
eukprot:TRINITY_DN4082_c0_g3_i2.p1 TRINITY_DN4082_c0_g3~~TRINITY_DN4082_c0_g3_i2.p1  ORF type:complete len:192 (+),score=29.58 TRINITY_DN4082_c0_g3_i2:447-1022(+)